MMTSLIFKWLYITFIICFNVTIIFGEIAYKEDRFIASNMLLPPKDDQGTVNVLLAFRSITTLGTDALSG